MPFLVGGILLLVGIGFLLQAFRADRAVARWSRAKGVVSQASQGHLTDDGRRWWNLQVAYRTDTGEEVSSSVKQISGNADVLTGAPVDVWYDPQRPERCHVALDGNTPGSSWFSYAFGAVFAVAGAAVLAWALR